jgi:mannan endo-1,4-beta-mannosidase
MSHPGARSFVRRRDGQLHLNESPFSIVGANNYYFAYSSEEEQNQLLALAGDFEFNTLRVWAFLDCASGPPSGDRVCFQYLPTGAEHPELNESGNGLERLDRAVMLAGERGVRLILTLTNYHTDFGGLPQYQQWFQLESLNDAYRNSQARAAYRSYAESLITRHNPLTGLTYAEDPTILAWEICNEPRAPEDPSGCDLLTGWLREMSDWIRVLAPNQLIAAGDEGFMKRSFHWGDWLYDGSCGVNGDQILHLPNIDIGTFHLYPTQWSQANQAEAFGLRWIQEHIDAGRSAGKPVLLEEFGLPASPDRDGIYAKWLARIEQEQSAGDLAWMIGLPGKGDEYLLSSAVQSLALRDHAAHYSTRTG